jgi:hypothetical protein
MLTYERLPNRRRRPICEHLADRIDEMNEAGTPPGLKGHRHPERIERIERPSIRSASSASRPPGRPHPGSGGAAAIETEPAAIEPARIERIETARTASPW